MSKIQRICEQCGESGPLEARYCPHCGYDSQGSDPHALPVPRKQLPMALSKAALPILAGAASLVLRAGWKLLQQRLATTTPEEAAQALSNLARRPAAPPQPAPQPATRRPRRTIHIRSNWAVGDANGVWRQGSSEHTIEIDE